MLDESCPKAAWREGLSVTKKASAKAGDQYLPLTHKKIVPTYCVGDGQGGHMHMHTTRGLTACQRGGIGMTKTRTLAKTGGEPVNDLILTLRSKPVLVDADLAALYGVTTKALNQAVQRNIERFPEGFKFQLNQEEKDELVTNCDQFKRLKHSTTLPHAFTEQGVAMLSAVLRSDTAIRTSISIINAFVAMRQFIQTNNTLMQRMSSLELQQMALAKDTQTQFEKVFSELAEKNNIEPTQGVFFEGQIFD
eukprot:gene26985-48461_t